MKNLFNSIQLKKPNKNVFDLTHDVKLDTDMGVLTPICAMEAVPGDKFTIGCEAMIRFAPMIAPVMHRFNATMHYFFVPNRILWSNWERWITSPTPTDVHPFIDCINIDSRLGSYLGIGWPQTQLLSINVSAFPFAAYQCIYNEYYRDQNLIAEVNWQLTDGDNTANADLYTMRRRAWQHDYFTASLPFAQKGAAVEIPVTGEVVLNPTLTGSAGKFVDPSTGIVTDIGDVLQSGVVPNGAVTINGNDQIYDPNGSLVIDGAETTINDLRRAFRLQEWLEKNARAGTRYIENILAHFGVRSSDARLQRPEYITGIKAPVVISEVLNTTGEASGLPQGNMSGHGIGVVSGKYGSYFCEEHGWIIGVMSIMPETAYTQMIPKKFLKINDPFEYFWPSFAHIGEQEVLKKEVYIDALDPEELWGYVPRYAEYKFENNRVAGEAFNNSLDYWHEARIFATEPELNEDFISCTPSNRIFAVTAGNHLFCHVLNKVTAVRPMPKFGTPSF